MFQMNKKYQILNGSVLKITAIITMLIDHIGAAILYFIPTLFLLNPENQKNLELFYGIFRNVGRIAFPLFCLWRDLSILKM